MPLGNKANYFWDTILDYSSISFSGQPITPSNPKEVENHGIEIEKDIPF